MTLHNYVVFPNKQHVFLSLGGARRVDQTALNVLNDICVRYTHTHIFITHGHNSLYTQCANATATKNINI